MAIAAVADAAEPVASQEGATPSDDQDKVTTGSRERPRQLAVARAEFWCTLLACCLVLLQANLPYLEPLFVWRAVTDMTYKIEAGRSPAIRFPRSGPYDQRLGYVSLPSLIQRLQGRDFDVERQARQSQALLRFVEAGGYAVYHEKFQAGLVLSDCSGLPLEAAAHPSAVYSRFDDIPPILVETLRFIEDRDLLDPTHPYRNPAVEWRRFALAAAGRLGGVLDPGLRRVPRAFPRRCVR
jgi:hypothetical protein